MKDCKMDTSKLASSEQGFQRAVDRFSAACDEAVMKISTKTPRYYASSKTQASACCSTLQQVEKFK